MPKCSQSILKAGAILDDPAVLSLAEGVDQDFLVEAASASLAVE